MKTLRPAERSLFPSRFSQVGRASLTLWLFAVSALATPRAPLPALPHAAPTLFHTRFDEAYWHGHERASWVTVDYGTLTESFSGYAMQRTGKRVGPFVVPALDATGRLNVATDAGFGFGAPGRGRNGNIVENGDWLVPGEWHWVVLNYGPKTELWIDGALAADGSGTVALPPQVAGFGLGSTVLGSETAGGEFEDVYAFRRPLTERQVGFYYPGMKKRSWLGPISAVEEAAVAEWRAKRIAEREALGDLGGGGALLLRFVGFTSECITNSPLYLTNTVCVLDTNSGWTVTFDVQGTNGPVDIFTTTNLVGNSITNSQWTWLERGPSCSTYQYTNQPTGQSY